MHKERTALFIVFDFGWRPGQGLVTTKPVAITANGQAVMNRASSYNPIIKLY